MLATLFILHCLAWGEPAMTERELFLQLEKLGVGCYKTNNRIDLAAHSMQTEAHMPLVAQLRDLDELHCNSSILSDKGLACLKGHPRLRHLEILSTQVTPDGLAILETLPNLQILDLNLSIGGDQALQQIGKCKSLKELSFRGSDITSRGMAFLKNLSQLESLDLSYSAHLTSDGLTVLKNFPRLTGLTLSECPADEAALDTIAQLKNLESVSLGPNNSTDTAIAKLKTLPKLVSLGFHGSRLTANGLQQLPAQLELLDIRDLELDDKKLSALLHLRKAQALVLNGKTVSKASQKAFKKAFRQGRDDLPNISW